MHNLLTLLGKPIYWAIAVITKLDLSYRLGIDRRNRIEC